MRQSEHVASRVSLKASRRRERTQKTGKRAAIRGRGVSYAGVQNYGCPQKSTTAVGAKTAYTAHDNRRSHEPMCGSKGYLVWA